MDLKDYLRIVRRQWRVALLIAIAVPILYYVYLQRQPQWYAASGTALVPRNDLQYQWVVSDAFVPESVSYQTKVQMLTGKPVLLLAARGLFPYRPEMVTRGRDVLQQLWQRLETARLEDQPDALLQYFQALTREEQGPANPQGPVVFDRAQVSLEAERLAREVKVDDGSQRPGYGTELVTVTVESLDATEARDRVAAVLGAYQRVLRDLAESPLVGTRDHLRRKLDDERQALARVEAQIATFRTEHDIFSPTIQGQQIGQNLAALEAEYRERQFEFDKVQAQIARLASEGTPLYDLAFFGTLKVSADDVVAEVERRVRDLEIERDRLKVSYADTWPAVKEVEAALARLQPLLAEKRKERNETVMDVTKRVLDSQRQTLEAAVTRLSERVDRERARLQELSRSEAHLVELEATRAALRETIDYLAQRANDVEEKRLSQRRAVEISEPPGLGLSVTRRSAWPLALLVAAFMALVGAYLAEYLSTAIRTEYDVRRYLNLPVLGRVPRIPEGQERMLATLPPKDPLAEIYASAVTLMQSLIADRHAHVFLVASYRPGEGKSTVSSNLAIASARLGYRAVLVDADMRKPTVHKIFSLDNTEGLSTVLSGRVEAQAALARELGPNVAAGQYAAGLAPLLRESGVEGLRVLPAGPSHHNPVGLLRGEFMDLALADLRDMADVVFIDVPPVGGAVETLVLAPRVDGIVLLVAAGSTTKEEVTEAKRLIENARGKLLGVILNFATYESRGYYYYTVSKYYREA